MRKIVQSVDSAVLPLGDGYPQANTLRHPNEGLILCFTTDRHRRKVLNILLCDWASVTPT